MSSSNNPNDFQPYKPEIKKVVEITAREVALIKKLRQFGFGKFLVYKANNLIIRVESTSSSIIDEDDEIEL